MRYCIYSEKQREQNMTDTFRIDNISFGDLSSEVLAEMFTDGRLASHFLERQLCEWYPHLTFVNKKGYDHVDANGNRYDQKCFTNQGLKFAPSSMYGAGRKVNLEEAVKHIEQTQYICCDITEFPVVRVKFATGKELLEDYPNCSIKKSEREKFFNE